MANRLNRTPRNVSGIFYVDDTCIDCGLCPSLAPATFRRDDELGVSYVHRQPTTDAELALASEAKESCPTESIADNWEAGENNDPTPTQNSD